MLEVKLLNDYNNELENNQKQIIKLSKDCEKNSILPYDLIKIIIKENMDKTDEIEKNYQNKKKILHISYFLMENNVDLFYDEDVVTDDYTEEEFRNYLTQLLKYVSKEIQFFGKNYLNQYVIRVCDIK